MKWLFACGLLLFASLAQAQLRDVAICGGCSTDSQYENTAIQVAGTNFNGERQILVVNPATNMSRHVTVTHTPAGEVPYAVDPSGSVAQRSSKSPASRGTLIELKHSPDAAFVFVDDARPSNFQAGGSTASSWPTSAGERAEIGALIEFGRNDFVIVMPNSTHFSSFSGRNQPANANQIYSAMTAKNPGWVISQVGAKLRKLIQNRLKTYFGRSFQVCAVFNNGDSACFNPDVATPSLENLIPGSAKTRYGAGIGGWGGGGDGMNTNTIGPNTQYGPSGSSGRTGELWLFCSFIGIKLISCEIRIL